MVLGLKNGGHMDTLKYLRREGTDLVFVWTPTLAERSDMRPYYGPVPLVNENLSEDSKVVQVAQKVTEALAPLNAQEVTAPPLSTREEKILEIVKSIPRESFVAPAFGRPAMPRLDEVKEKCGFDVSVDEVVSAVNKLEM